MTFSSNLNWRSYIISIAETASKKIGEFLGFIYEEIQKDK